MSPTSNIGFALIIGFIVFVTVRGELPSYLCVIGLGSNCSTATTASTAVTTTSTLLASIPDLPSVFA